MPLDRPATLTGLAIGDALGMPFETMTFMAEALMKWDGSFLSGETNTLQPERKPGEGTDDTKMAKALAYSLLQQRTYDPIEAVHQYRKWYESGDLRGIGKTIREAMERVGRGHHWNSCGVEHSQGNGTAMRVAPLGLFFRNSLLTVADMARVDATLTHRSVEAQEGSAAVALGVALMATANVPKQDILAPILNLLHSDPQESTITMVETRLLDVQQFLREGKGKDPKEVLKFLIESGTGARVAETVPAAFLCFLTTDSFKDAVELAVRAGGDCDTTAAITGAFAGTHYGFEQVQPYLKQLEDAQELADLDQWMWERAPKFPEDA